MAQAIQMARSKGVVVSVKIPINWEFMTNRSRQRLRQIVGRDTRVIRSYLGIIEQHEHELLAGRNKTKIDEAKLDKLTLTAIKTKHGQRTRPTVPHDLKSRYPRISVNELQECRITATSMYESYLEIRRNRHKNASRPCSVNDARRTPRWVFSQRFSLIRHDTSIAKWWLNLRDSFDSVPNGKMIHDRLLIPLKMSPFHLNQIGRGEIKAVQIFTDREGKWWTTLAVRVIPEDSLETKLPVAILGIDLGIKKAACSTLLTPEKTRETRYFLQKDKVKVIMKYDEIVASLQREMHTRCNGGLSSDKVSKKLRKTRSKRENVAKEYDRVLVHELLDYISELSKKYTLYVAIGRLKYIRQRARRGNYKGRKFRGIIHSWAFARITEGLKHGLAQLGWMVDGHSPRFRIVPESWTSIMCWKCGSRGIRPKQNHFHCPLCGYTTNGDKNGSINIAARMLKLTASLHNVRGLGLWTRVLDKTRRARPKARKKISLEGKSLLSKKERSSSSGESAAVLHAQSSLLDFSDDVEMGDHDPAVERTVEILTVTDSDASVVKQEKEVRSSGGILSR